MRSVVVMGCVGKRGIKAGISRRVVERKMDGFNEISWSYSWLIDDVEDGKAATARSQPGWNGQSNTQSNRGPWNGRRAPCPGALSAGSEWQWQPTHTLSGSSAASRRQRVPVMVIGDEGQEAGQHPKQGTLAVTMHVTGRCHLLTLSHFG